MSLYSENDREYDCNAQSVQDQEYLGRKISHVARIVRISRPAIGLARSCVLALGPGLPPGRRNRLADGTTTPSASPLLPPGATGPSPGAARPRRRAAQRQKRTSGASPASTSTPYRVSTLKRSSHSISSACQRAWCRSAPHAYMPWLATRTTGTSATVSVAAT